VGHAVLHVNASPALTGSGDRLYDWTHAFTLFTIATVVTLAWSVVDRDRLHYQRLYTWFRLAVRIALGTTMLAYGFAKLFPLQMPTVFLHRLLEPFGNFSPMGVLWHSIGAAPWYERFIGLVEVMGGALLLLPRTTLLGALVCLTTTVGVFTVNVTYDVPVKLFSLHLLLLSLLLLAPDLPRLLDAIVRNRPVNPAPDPSFGGPRAHRNWLLAQSLFAVWVVASGFYQGPKNVKTRGSDAPVSPLFGIWDVDTMSIDGNVRPPLLTDTTRLRNVVFQYVDYITLHRMDASYEWYTASVDTLKKTIALKGDTDSSSTATLTYRRVTSRDLLLDGAMNGKPVHLHLTLHDLNRFLLVSRGFNWVQAAPLNK